MFLGRRAATERKDALLCFPCLRSYKHCNILAPVSPGPVLAFFLFPSFSLTLCPQFWARKDLFLEVEFKEKKWSCNMPESSGNKVTLSCQLIFLLLGFVPWPQCCPSAQGVLSAACAKPAGCHCGIPAVALRFPIFIVLEIKISCCNFVTIERLVTVVIFPTCF